MAHSTKKTKQRDAPIEYTFRVCVCGLLYAMACSSLPQEEVERRAKNTPCGTKAGWVLAMDGFPEGMTENPYQCPDHATHKHYLFMC